MTAYELHNLINEQANIGYAAFETWIGITAAVLFAGYYGGKKLGLLLRNIIVLAYTGSCIVAIVNIFQIYLASEKYHEEIERISGMVYPYHLGLGIFTGLIVLLIYLIVSISVISYFIRSTSQADE